MHTYLYASQNTKADFSYNWMSNITEIFLEFIFSLFFFWIPIENSIDDLNIQRRFSSQQNI